MKRDPHLPPPEACDWLLSQEWSEPETVKVSSDRHESETYDCCEATAPVGRDETIDFLLPSFGLQILREDAAARQAAAITMGVFAVEVPRPIPLAERQPGPGDLGGFDSNCCWWGHWQGDHWLWIWDYEPVRDETHWLPASAQVLPARCWAPEGM